MQNSSLLMQLQDKNTSAHKSFFPLSVDDKQHPLMQGTSPSSATSVYLSGCLSSHVGSLTSLHAIGPFPVDTQQEPRAAWVKPQGLADNMD